MRGSCWLTALAVATCCGSGCVTAGVYPADLAHERTYEIADYGDVGGLRALPEGHRWHPSYTAPPYCSAPGAFTLTTPGWYRGAIGLVVRPDGTLACDEAAISLRRRFLIFHGLKARHFPVSGIRFVPLEEAPE